jgi:hypothetical protein
MLVLLACWGGLRIHRGPNPESRSVGPPESTRSWIPGSARKNAGGPGMMKKKTTRQILPAHAYSVLAQASAR